MLFRRDAIADEKKKGYPKIPRSNWLLLREKFKLRAPERVTPSYVATALGMGESSASANIIPPLRIFSLIDDAGKPSDLACDWRDDSKYAEVCKQILERTYAQELRDLFHDASASSKDIENWFARSARVGQSAARGYAATYLMLPEADLSKTKEQKGVKPKAAGAAARPAKPPADQAVSNNGDERGRRSFSPRLHVDIQIHISPDSSPEQIDKIFESMAKHLPLIG